MRRFLLCATALAFALNSPGILVSVYADSPPIDRVEEDWQLIIGSPDTDEEGPQMTICMSPTSDGSSPFVAFDLNYREYPEFQTGGLQVQVWSNNQVVQTSTQHTEMLATANETITWTQSMGISNSQVVYQVKSGNSVTWSTFGGDSNLSVSFATSLSTMSAYTPAASARTSGVTWQSNRVTKLVLVQVRYYSGSVLVTTDTTARTVVSNATSS